MIVLQFLTRHLGLEVAIPLLMFGAPSLGVILIAIDWPALLKAWLSPDPDDDLGELEARPYLKLASPHPSEPEPSRPAAGHH
jgi:hypothetical protein